MLVPRIYDSFHQEYLADPRDLWVHSKIAGIGSQFIATMILLAVKAICPLVENLMDLVDKILLAQPLSFKLPFIFKVKSQPLDHFPKVKGSEVSPFFFDFYLLKVARHLIKLYLWLERQHDLLHQRTHLVFYEFLHRLFLSCWMWLVIGCKTLISQEPENFLSADEVSGGDIGVRGLNHQAGVWIFLLKSHFLLYDLVLQIILLYVHGEPEEAQDVDTEMGLDLFGDND